MMAIYLERMISDYYNEKQINNHYIKNAMKYLILSLSVLVMTASCEKSPITIEDKTPNTEFQTQILDGYFVTAIDFDSEGNAWIGTFKQGLIKYTSSEIHIYNNENSQLPESAVIHDIAVDSKDNVWVGTDGLLKYDGTDFTLFNSDNSSIPENHIPSVAIDSRDNVWFSSSRSGKGGFVMFNGQDWSVYTPENSKLPVHAVQSIAIDRHDDVWLGLGEVVNNSWLVNVSENVWTTYPGLDNGFRPYFIGNIQVNQKNQIVGAIDYSLSSHYTNDRPQAFIYDRHSLQLLQTDGIYNTKFITLDNNENIWFGLYGGYALKSGAEWIIDKETFSEEGVFAIEQGPDDKIWMGTGNGIFINY